MPVRSRLLAVATLLVAIVGFVPLASPASAADGDGPGQGEPWIVSLGDSAISGEGGRWAGNSNRPVGVVDALGERAYADGSAPGPIGIGSLCLDSPDGATAGSTVTAATCVADAASQTWHLDVDDTVRNGHGLCLTAVDPAAGSALSVGSCTACGDHRWVYRNRRLVNEASGRCPSASPPTEGAALVLADCSGGSSDATQVFALPAAYEQIAGCHRSRSAAVHIDRTTDSTGAAPGTAVNTMNFACSGARTYTKSYSPGDDYKPGIDFATTPDGLPANHKGQAALLQEFATDHNVTSVALMIGANNFGYADVLETCVINWFFSPWWWPNYCSDDADIANRVTPTAKAQLTADVSGAIDNVRLAMSQAGYDESMYTIFVHTYWGVMPVGNELRYRERGYDRQTLGGCGFWNRDASWGEQVARPTLNGAVTDAVSGLGYANVKLVDLGDITAEHELCDDDVALMEEAGLGHWTEPGAADASEWITQVRVGPALPDWLNGSPPEYQLQEGGHANYWGQLAMRNCLRSAYNDGGHRGVRCAPAGGTNSYGEPNLSVTVLS